ncbi:MAG: hypothetical protein ACREN3_05855 [Gemmatimonadaceae bacterium]
MSAALEAHLILDNHDADKHPQVRAPLGRHWRFQMHFAPTFA